MDAIIDKIYRAFRFLLDWVIGYGASMVMLASTGLAIAEIIRRYIFRTTFHWGRYRRTEKTRIQQTHIVVAGLYIGIVDDTVFSPGLVGSPDRRTQHDDGADHAEHGVTDLAVPTGPDHRFRSDGDCVSFPPVSGHSGSSRKICL